MKEHIKSVYEGKKYHCTKCSSQFSRKSILKVHIESVHEEKKHQCSVCQAKFGLKRNLERHIESVHEEKKHQCTFCLSKYGTKYYLKLHIKSVHEEKKYHCSLCLSKFGRKSDLKRHIKSVHESKQLVGPQKHPWGQKEKSFSSRKQLKDLKSILEVKKKFPVKNATRRTSKAPLRSYFVCTDKWSLQWTWPDFFEKTCGEMNRKHELVARLGSSIKCLSCPLNFQSSNQTKRWEFQNYFKLVFLNLGLRFLFGFIKCMCILNQGPLNIWTELFPNFHFLKLQLRTQ